MMHPGASVEDTIDGMIYSWIMNVLCGNMSVLYDLIIILLSTTGMINVDITHNLLHSFHATKQFSPFIDLDSLRQKVPLFNHEIIQSFNHSLCCCGLYFVMLMLMFILMIILRFYVMLT